MISTAARQSLSQDLRRLVTGRVTSDEFDVLYFERYSESEDDGVREVIEFAYGLYSSDGLYPYRLRGLHAVDPATRTMAARCVLFLRSEREYQWPAWPSNFVNELALMIGLYVGGVLAVISVVLLMASPRDPFTAWFVAFSAVVLIISFVIALSDRPTPERSVFAAAGDFDVWPFLRRTDFDKACETCHLLGKG